MFSADDVAVADAPTLRSMLATLATAHNEARAAAAHHALQHSLLAMSSAEDMKRMEVELDMTQREVDVLHAVSRGRLDAHAALALSTPPPLPLSDLPSTSSSDPHPLPAISTPDLLTTLQAHCRRVEADNHTLSRRLADARTLILERERMHVDEAERLRQRIAQNRRHMHLLSRVASGASNLPVISTGWLPPLTPAYISTYLSSGRNDREPPVAAPTPVPLGRTQRTDGRQPFAALLLAGDVLSQEASSSAPHTRPSRRGPSHAHTPLQTRTVPASRVSAPPRDHAYYHTTTTTPSTRVDHSPRVAHAHLDATTPSSIPTPTPLSRARRRESRDSTISASQAEDEDADARADWRDADSALPDLQQPKRERERRPSLVVRSSPTPAPTAPSEPSKFASGAAGGGMQTRLYGPIRKPGVSAPPALALAPTSAEPTAKRKLSHSPGDGGGGGGGGDGGGRNGSGSGEDKDGSSGDAHPHSKRTRVDATVEGVGLGIGIGVESWA